MNLLLVFILLNVLNVVLQTVKSLVTNKGGKFSAAITSAIAYSLYTVVLVYMQCDLTTFAKAAIVGGCNLVGVYVVKSLEEKRYRKKAVWKIEYTIEQCQAEKLLKILQTRFDSQFNFSPVGKWYVINLFATEKKQLQEYKKIIALFGGKYIITEGKQF